MKLQVKGNKKIKKYKNPEKIVKILKKLRSKGLNVPKVLSSNKSSITFDYIKGKSLDKVKLTTSLVDKAAELLARLNKTRIKGLRKSTKLLDSFDKRVNELLEKGLLKSIEARKLIEEFNKLKPKKIEFCLGHFDYQPSNLILNKQGLWMIDFEGLIVGPIGVELSKACYHFGKAFLDHYSRHGDSTHYHKNMEFYDLRELVSQSLNQLNKRK